MLYTDGSFSDKSKENNVMSGTVKNGELPRSPWEKHWEEKEV